MTFDTDERSVEDGRPRDLYTFDLPAVTYRLTPGVRDIVFDGQTYRAVALSRENTRTPSPTSGETSLEISIVVSHPIVQRYLRAGIPPSSIDVTVRRLQLTSGEAEFEWHGTVKSLSVDGEVAKLHVPSRLSEALIRRLPTLGVGRNCGHVLYDGSCTINRNAFKVATTVSNIALDGRTITVAGMGGHPDQWAQFGELLHLASGERMTVLSQLGTDVKIHLPIVDMQVGDSVEVYAGCAHDAGTCADKFDNLVNFGGMPELPTKNPFLPNGYGIIEQE
jgi:uncharacterized phage protein (TIGR02218 family)